MRRKILWRKWFFFYSFLHVTWLLYRMQWFLLSMFLHNDIPLIMMHTFFKYSSLAAIYKSQSSFWNFGWYKSEVWIILLLCWKFVECFVCLCLCPLSHLSVLLSTLEPSLFSAHEFLIRVILKAYDDCFFMHVICSQWENSHFLNNIGP